MAKQIEGVLRRRRFNQLGGLQLDRDVRALRTALVKTIGGSRIDVRDRLARLTEISRLLSLPSLEDVQLHWEGVAFSQDFPLTADEVKSFAGKAAWCPHKQALPLWLWLSCVSQLHCGTNSPAHRLERQRSQPAEA